MIDKPVHGCCKYVMSLHNDWTEAQLLVITIVVTVNVVEMSVNVYVVITCYYKE